MMRLFINSLAASAGGGLTYIRNVVPVFAATPDVHVAIALDSVLREEFGSFPNITFLPFQATRSRRYWHEQYALPELIQREHADVLLSTGNFALRKSPVPQILLSRNSIYTSPDFYHDLLTRREYRIWLETHFQALLAKRSIFWADVTVAPSRAFAADLQRWTGKPTRAIYHGFDRELFTCDATPLSKEAEDKLQESDACVKVLFVSHYNYYRNFETLIRALPILRDYFRGSGRCVRLLLTCRLAQNANPGSYRTERAVKLVHQVGVSDMVVELGTIPYGQLRHLYRRADVYVSAAYTETFAHPLVEAMASGLPVVASDLPVHREICGEAARYFPPFSSHDLATRVAEVISAPETMRRMSIDGYARAGLFSWRKHVDELLALASSLVGSKR
jgi:glycosyltransferase involved in cell wall biosynthesis